MDHEIQDLMKQASAEYERLSKALGMHPTQKGPDAEPRIPLTVEKISTESLESLFKTMELQMKLIGLLNHRSL